jgi:hypothetical protein
MAPICRARGHFMKMAWPDYARREIVAALAEAKASSAVDRRKRQALGRIKPAFVGRRPKYRLYPDKSAVARAPRC